MAVTVTDLGGASVGGHMPTTAAALASAEAAIVLPMADIQGQITGAASAALQIRIQPPSFELAAAIEGSISTPGVTVDVSAMTSLGLELEAQFAALQASLDVVAEVSATFGESGGIGVRMYRIDGEVGGMAAAWGTQINGGLPGGTGPTQQGVAFVLVAADSGTIAALEALFGG